MLVPIWAKQNKAGVINTMNKEDDVYYQGLFWCSERQAFFRWKEYINYYEKQEKKKKSKE
jgi:hypothetical protein